MDGVDLTHVPSETESFLQGLGAQARTISKAGSALDALDVDKGAYERMTQGISTTAGYDAFMSLQSEHAIGPTWSIVQAPDIELYDPKHVNVAVARVRAAPVRAGHTVLFPLNFFHPDGAGHAVLAVKHKSKDGKRTAMHYYDSNGGSMAHPDGRMRANGTLARAFMDTGDVHINPVSSNIQGYAQDLHTVPAYCGELGACNAMRHAIVARMMDNQLQGHDPVRAAMDYRKMIREMGPKAARNFVLWAYGHMAMSASSSIRHLVGAKQKHAKRR